MFCIMILESRPFRLNSDNQCISGERHGSCVFDTGIISLWSTYLVIWNETLLGR